MSAEKFNEVNEIREASETNEAKETNEVSNHTNQQRISKKELLEETGISYGQLYRWKRERLIPEEWFVKQSSFTGQETYFPREKVLSRIQTILELKDSSSLEDLANLFSPDLKQAIQASDLANFETLNVEMFAKLQEGKGARQIFKTGEAVFLAALSGFIGKQDFDINAATKLASSTLIQTQDAIFEATQCFLFKLKQKDTDFHVVFCQSNTPPLFDSEIEVIGALALQETAELLGNFIQTINKES